MKKFVLALTALAAFTGSAMAADMAPRAYTKAPMTMPVAPSWTGFYIFGGAGGGLWDANRAPSRPPPGACRLRINQRQGGDGWFGTVGAGYDWQFNSSWVAGILADGQFGSLRAPFRSDFAALDRHREAAGHLGGWRRASAIWWRRTCSPTSMAVIPVRTGRVRPS